MATSASTPIFSRLFCSAYNLVMMLTLIILNRTALGEEPSTIVVEMFWSHLQVGIMLTVQKVTQCLGANISEKPLKSTMSCRKKYSISALKVK